MQGNQTSNGSLFGIEINPNLITPITGPLYQAYANNGPTWHIVLPASLLFTVALFGIILNSFVVIVTIATPTLRGSANYLMALICSCEVLHVSGHSIFFVIAVTGKNFVPLLAANLLMIPSIFALCTCMALMLSAAVDRLFAVGAPQKHTKICIVHKYLYLGIHTFACITLGLFNVYYATKYSIENPNIPTTGCISDLLSGNVGNLFFIYCSSVNMLTTLCYILIWGIIRCKKQVSQETNARLLRALVCIMLISVGGYIVNLAVYQAVFRLIINEIFDPILLWQLAFVAGVLLNIGGASNAIVLYFTSTEYRKAFEKNLTNLAKLFGVKVSIKVTKVSPMLPTSSQKKNFNNN